MFLRQLIQEQRFNRPSHLIALDLIRATNGVVFNPDYIELLDPIELDQRPEIFDDPNTCLPVNVDPAHDARFPYDTKFMIRRLELSLINVGGEVVIASGSFPFKLHEKLDQLNEQLGVQFDENDVKDVEIDAPGPFEFEAGKFSRVWIGSLAITVIDQDEPRYLFAIGDLDGFNPV